MSFSCHLYLRMGRRASVMAQMVKNLPAMRETRVQSLGQEDPLEKGMGTHSRIFAWRIPWTEEPGGLQSMESQRVGCDWTTNTHTHTHTHTHTRERGHGEDMTAAVRDWKVCPEEKGSGPFSKAAEWDEAPCASEISPWQVVWQWRCKVRTSGARLWN